jgi:hypothetical protein
MQVRRGSAPNLYEVESESMPGKWYQLYADGTVIKCNCEAYKKSKEKPKHCKHCSGLQEYLSQTEGGREPEEEGERTTGMITPPPPAQNGLSKWVVKIHGQETIRYPGLLAMAHEQGLIELKAEFISVTETLALAAAYAMFKDGRKFWDAGDATPSNVRVQVKAHFARMALTRAKARALRDALNIGLVSLEELEE